MKILILGHGQHGKDTVAVMIQEAYGLTFSSSSQAAFELAVWPFVQHRYESKVHAFEDRRNCRALWKSLISDYTKFDKSRLAREILAKNDMYVGMRCDQEYQASRELFDKVIWVHRLGFPAEKEMGIQYNPTEMHCIVNCAPLEILPGETKYVLGMKSQLKKIFE